MTSIIFNNDVRMEKNEQLKPFIKNGGGGFTTILMDGSIYVVVERLKEDTYEQVRNIAGAIARDLSRRG